MMIFPHKLCLYVCYTYMIIAKGVPFLLPACKRIGTAQLAGKIKTHYQKINFSNVFISLIFIQYRSFPIQIRTFSKMCRGMFFFSFIDKLGLILMI